MKPDTQDGIPSDAMSKDRLEELSLSLSSILDNFQNCHDLSDSQSVLVTVLAISMFISGKPVELKKWAAKAFAEVVKR